MAAYRRVYDSRHLQADCQEPGSAPGSSIGYLYLFLSPRLLDHSRTLPALLLPRTRAADKISIDSRYAALAYVDWYVPPAPAAANELHVAAAVDWRDRQTDR